MKIYIPILFFLFISGCSNRSPDDRAVASVDGEELTLKMIRQSVDSGVVLSDNFIMGFASQWTVDQLLFKEAQSAGFEKDADIEKSLELTRREMAIQKLLRTTVYTESLNAIPDSAVNKIYSSFDVRLYLKSDIALVSILIFNSEESAKTFRKNLSKGGVWRNETQSFQSNISSRTDSVFRQRESIPLLWNNIKSLKVGGISQGVQTPLGWVVVRLWEYYNAGEKSPLKFIEPLIKEELLREQNRKLYLNYLSNLKKKYHTTYMLPDSTLRN